MPESAEKMNRVGRSQSNTLTHVTTASDNIQQMKTAQPDTVESNRFYTRQQIEAMGICSWMTLRRAEKAGKLKVYSYGYRLRRYLGSDLLRWMEGKSSKPAKATTAKSTK